MSLESGSSPSLAPPPWLSTMETPLQRGLPLYQATSQALEYLSGIDRLPTLLTLPQPPAAKANFQTSVVMRSGAPFFRPAPFVAPLVLSHAKRADNTGANYPHHSLLIGRIFHTGRRKLRGQEATAPSHCPPQQSRNGTLKEVGHCPCSQIQSSGSDILLRGRGRPKEYEFELICNRMWRSSILRAFSNNNGGSGGKQFRGGWQLHESKKKNYRPAGLPEEMR